MKEAETTVPEIDWNHHSLQTIEQKTLTKLGEIAGLLRELIAQGKPLTPETPASAVAALIEKNAGKPSEFKRSGKR